MWAMGCILFEILQVRHPSQQIIKSGLIDPVLFRGSECYPLSFAKMTKTEEIDPKDQLKVILQQIHALTSLDECFIKSNTKTTLKYLRNTVKFLNSHES